MPNDNIGRGILFAVVAGLIFGLQDAVSKNTHPDLFVSLIGAAIIVGAGLGVMARERQLASRARGAEHPKAEAGPPH